MPQESSIRRADGLIGLFDRPVAAYEVCGAASPEWLYPAEAELVAKAVDKRRREFAGGRRTARQALGELGFPDAPLLVGERRAPAWPSGSVGSITHTDGYCGAVATSTEHYVGIGVDGEGLGRLQRKLEARICTEAELKWLDAMDEQERATMATVIFSAKEAFYKCQFAVTRGWLGFRDVTLHLAPGIFRVELHTPIPELAARADLAGRFFLTEDHVFAGIGLAAP